MLRGMKRRPFCEDHDLRPLTWRDGLLWRRAGRSLATAVVWTGIVLWLLSQLYEPGLFTVSIVTTLSLVLVSADLRQDRSDLPRWPRRTD